jgi:hypothetical protein
MSYARSRHVIRAAPPCPQALLHREMFSGHDDAIVTLRKNTRAERGCSTKRTIPDGR